jgi:medium-chain acyl-[acyl-carrier-protein] hydrolase
MATVLMSTPWLPYHKPKSLVKLRLFCFPYAGGNALIYRNWAASLPMNVEVCSVQLPGRGNRLREVPIKRMPALAEATLQGLLPYLDKPFAFFGHSMGALLGFELAQLLRKRYGKQPVHLFVSGRCAPQIEVSHPETYHLPREEFLDELRRLNGTPKEVLDHPDLMELMLPLLRADFEVCQSYRSSGGPPLSCPVSAFGGDQDQDIPYEHFDAWRLETESNFTLRMFAGDHFFLHSLEPELLQTLNRDLDQVLKTLPYSY